jgi:glutaminyl-peptide cyclotransferase
LNFYRLPIFLMLWLAFAGCGEQTAPISELPKTPFPIVRLRTNTTTPLPSDTMPPSIAFDGGQAWANAEMLMAFGPRVVGGESNRRAGDWILAQLSSAGWDTFTDDGTARGVPVRNLVGRKGVGPVVILAAHYDSRLRADRDPVSTGEPVPGAEDGASGVSVLLELARTLRVDWTHKQVWLAFLDAEDNGNLDGWDWAVGALQFAQRVDRDRQRGITVTAFVLLDMVGDADQRFYYEGNSDPHLREQIWDAAQSLGYSENFIRTLKYTMLDDHVPFRALGIPAVDLIDFDYPYWHTRDDTLDKLSPASLERVGRTIEFWLTGV